MSETPQQKLSELINILVTAIPLVTHLPDDDAVRRGLLDTLLTAQMRDPARRNDLVRWLLEDPAPEEMPDVLTTTARLHRDRLDRLRIVPNVAGGRHPLAEGTCVHARPVRYNLAAGYAHHSDGDRSACDRWASFVPGPPTPPAYAAAAQAYAQQRAQEDITARCLTCNATMIHPDVNAQVSWLRVHERLHDAGVTHAPDATVQSSTIATDVDASGRVCDCDDDDCGGDCARSRPAAVAAHNGDYGVTGHPSENADQRIGIRAETDGDTSDWIGNHAIECMARDCTGCA